MAVFSKKFRNLFSFYSGAILQCCTVHFGVCLLPVQWAFSIRKLKCWRTRSCYFLNSSFPLCICSSSLEVLWDNEEWHYFSSPLFLTIRRQYCSEHVIQLRKLGKRTGRHPEAVQLASSRAALFTYFPLWGESASTYFTNFHLMFLFYCNITSRGSRICLPKISFLGLLC